MSCKSVTVLLLISSIPFVSNGQNSLDTRNCIENEEQVSVIGQKFTEDPPSYWFRVANHTNESVKTLAIGRQQARQINTHIPTSMGAPKGWTPSQVFAEERPYISYLWISESPEVEIPSGQTLSGFSVQLSTWKPEQPMFFLDEEVLQKDLLSIPFRVSTSGGECFIGNVRPDSL